MASSTTMVSATSASAGAWFTRMPSGFDLGVAAGIGRVEKPAADAGGAGAREPRASQRPHNQRDAARYVADAVGAHQVHLARHARVRSNFQAVGARIGG